MENDTRETDRRKSAQRASRGTRVSVDELVAKSHTVFDVFDRVVPFLERAASRIRQKLARK